MKPVSPGACPRALTYRSQQSRLATISSAAFFCALLSGVCSGLVGPACASMGLGPDRRSRDAFQASSSPSVEQNAISTIPFEKLQPAQRAKISSLLSGSHIFRRLPAHVGPGDPDLYLFLVRHPDVVVGIWEQLGISQLRMKQVGPEKYQTHETSGTVGTSEFIYCDPTLHVIWVEGVFRSPLLGKPVCGTSLLILRSGYVREPDGRHYITSRLDTFTHIDNLGIEFITKTLQPLMGRVVDHNFVQTSAFVASLSKTAANDPRGVRRLAGKLKRVHPEVRQQLGKLAYQVADNADRRSQRRLAAKPVSREIVKQTPTRR